MVPLRSAARPSRPVGKPPQFNFHSQKKLHASWLHARCRVIYFALLGKKKKVLVLLSVCSGAGHHGGRAERERASIWGVWQHPPYSCAGLVYELNRLFSGAVPGQDTHRDTHKRRWRRSFLVGTAAPFERPPPPQPQPPRAGASGPAFLLTFIHQTWQLRGAVSSWSRTLCV